MKKLFKHFYQDSLYRNSIYLMLSTAIMAGFGFFFWLLNARLFTTEQIGLATTLISVVTLIASLSNLGLNTGLIRYLPKSDKKNSQINTAFTIVIVASILVGIVYLLGINWFSPKLNFLKDNLTYQLIFIILVVFMSLNGILDSIFIAYRSSVYVLLKNSILSAIKLALPITLIALGSFGIFVSFGLGVAIAFLIGLSLLTYKFDYSIFFSFDKPIIRQIARFSFGNYLAGFLNSLPTLILPILITNKLGPHISAYYYIDIMIANLIYIIPQAATQSLFAEGSFSEDKIGSLLKQAAKITYGLMIPVIIVTIFGGHFILSAFGKEYANQGSVFLSLLAISGIFLAINNIFSTILRIQHRVRTLIIINLLTFSLVMSLSYFLIKNLLTGLGFAWLISQFIASLVYILMVSKKRKLLKKEPNDKLLKTLLRLQVRQIF